MSKIQMLKDAIMNGEYDARFKRVYVTDEAVKAQHERYVSLANDFAEIFSEDRDARLFSAPGRTEVGGNHTDHNHGRVLAAGINLDAIAVASKNDENVVRVKSRGYKMMGFSGFVCIKPYFGILKAFIPLPLYRLAHKFKLNSNK